MAVLEANEKPKNFPIIQTSGACSNRSSSSSAQPKQHWWICSGVTIQHYSTLIKISARANSILWATACRKYLKWRYRHTHTNTHTLTQKCTRTCTGAYGQWLGQMDINSWTLTHLDLDKMAPIPQTIFRCIFVTEKFCILIEISMKFVPKGLIDNNPHLV